MKLPIITTVNNGRVVDVSIAFFIWNVDIVVFEEILKDINDLTNEFILVFFFNGRLYNEVAHLRK